MAVLLIMLSNIDQIIPLEKLVDVVADIINQTTVQYQLLLSTALHICVMNKNIAQMPCTKST